MVGYFKVMLFRLFHSITQAVKLYHKSYLNFYYVSGEFCCTLIEHVCNNMYASKQNPI